MTQLVIFYSRTGNNKSSASAIAKTIKADMLEIGEDGTPKGKADLSAYDTLLFCFPIHAFSPAMPVKQFIPCIDLKGKKAGAVAVCGGHPWMSEKSMKKMIEKQGGSFLGFAWLKDSGDRAADDKLAVEKANEILSGG